MAMKAVTTVGNVTTEQTSKKGTTDISSEGQVNRLVTPIPATSTITTTRTITTI